MQTAADLERQHGRYLRAVAYRMLGSVADAEDVVQEAMTRFLARAPGPLEQPRAYMTRVVTRLCLDQLKSARVQRESYVGPWLPEPQLDEAPTPHERAHEVTVAMMLVLERLSPLERAAFLLHDVFGVGYDELAVQLERSAPTCRKLVERARQHMRDARARFDPAPGQGAELARTFFLAVQRGDAAELTRMLVGDAVLYSDGGGKRSAALNPVLGPDRIVRFLLGIRRRWGSHTLLAAGSLGGSPGVIARDPEGHLYTLAVDLVGDPRRDQDQDLDGGRIRALYIVRNPDKLRTLRSRFDPD